MEHFDKVALTPEPGEEGTVIERRGEERRKGEKMSQGRELILSYFISDQTRSIQSRLVGGFVMERTTAAPPQPVSPLNEHTPQRDFKEQKNLIHSARFT